MSSWLSLSLPNPFKFSQSDDQTPPSSPPETTTPPSPDHSPPSPSAGVKDDLSVFGQTIGRQLRGVAAFLAPPPSPPPPHSATAIDDASSSQTFLGIKNDLVEIGGSFKTSLSLLSSNKAVTEISKFASNLLQFQDEGDEAEGLDEDENAVGVTEEVVEFVSEISSRPECWTDFPLSMHNGFVMSDAQRGHAATVERLVPSFAALRQKICSDLTDEEFWMIYFILLLPRLNENDFKLLSTPKIVEAREILLQKVQNRSNAPVESSKDSETVDLSEKGSTVTRAHGDKSASHGKEVSSEAVNAAERIEIDNYEKNTEQWLEDVDVNTCTSIDAQEKREKDNDISFSDLEDDDNDLSDRPSGLRPARSDKISSPSKSNDWVRLNENSGISGPRQKAGQSTSPEKDSEGEESNDWLTVDDIDLDSLAAV